MTNSTKALIGVLLAGTVGIIIFLFVQLSGDSSKPITIGTKKAQACAKGADRCLPDVHYTDVNGVKYTPQSLAGKVVVVNFWATWCKPCEHEIPDLSKIYSRYHKHGLEMLGVMVDDPDSQSLLNFQSDHEMAYPVVRMNSDINTSYLGTFDNKMPTTVIFDRGGKQVAVRVGALSEQALLDIVEPLLEQKI